MTRPGWQVCPILQKQRVFASFDFAALRAEVDQVELAASAADSPVVFGHNDVLSGETCHLLTSAQYTACLHSAHVGVLRM